MANKCWVRNLRNLLFSQNCIANVDSLPPTDCPTYQSEMKDCKSILQECMLNLMVLFDFHATTSSFLDFYLKIIKCVGSEIEQPYNSDKLIPAWCLGAKTEDGTMSSCLELNSEQTDRQVNGVDKIIEALKNAVKHFEYDTPVSLSEGIKEALKKATESESYNYYVLLIIASGNMMDIPKTVPYLVEASKSPLSILIIGEGVNNWQHFDDVMKSKIKRDMVRFVPTSELHEKCERLGDKQGVADALLKEIPKQYKTYKNNIKP